MNYDDHAMSAAETIFALRERVKELTCLYKITDLANRSELSFEEFMTEVLKIIPRSMQYPSATGCRIEVDGVNYETANLEAGSESLTIPICAKNQTLGSLHVFYQDSANVEFIPEEEQLLKGVAQQLAQVLERRTVEQDEKKLQEKMRRADRLATIGQLSAGIANEVSEPLSGIIELFNSKKSEENLPSDLLQKLQKVSDSAQHAQLLIRKLMLFTRQVAPVMQRVNLNHLIRDGLSFLENRAQKQGVEFVLELQPVIPEVYADSSQIHQALVNLAVNALQAMPEGGKLSIRTHSDHDIVQIMISDTGIGMDDELKQRIFVPFFTTKEADLGTGLGLPVVHGIINSHHGTIRVESKPSQGTTFHISLQAFNPVG